MFSKSEHVPAGEAVDDVVLGARVRAARTQIGISLRELAQRLGVSPATVSAHETGKTGISVARLHRLADELDVSVAHLLAPVVPADRRVVTRPDHADASSAGWRHYDPLDLDPVLAAALAAIGETGYHGCTVRDIADRAGLSVPGIYHHYRSKQDMLVALFELTMDDLLVRSRAALTEGTTPGERFARVVESLALYHTNRRELGFLGATEMRSLLPHSRARIAALRIEQQRMIDGEVELAVRDGTFTTPRPHEAARAVVTMCTALPQWFDPSGPATAQSIADLYVAFALDLMGARTAP